MNELGAWMASVLDHPLFFDVFYSLNFLLFSFLAFNKQTETNAGMIKIVSERGLSTHYTVDTHTQAVQKSTITTHKHK